MINIPLWPVIALYAISACGIVVALVVEYRRMFRLWDTCGNCLNAEGDPAGCWVYCTLSQQWVRSNRRTCTQTDSGFEPKEGV